ncbi:MAG TPA: ABC transporter permease, partial [Polyangia bacterium]|nr:ABC transporter permease [Polyangia bacterium]
MDAIRIALRAIRKNMLRAVLTVLGILIGVASVVVITALGDGARQSVGGQIESLGSNFIIVFPQQSNASGARGAQGGGVRLTEEDGRAIKREAVSIAAVAPVLRAQSQFVYMDKNVSTSALGTNRDYFTVRSWKVKTGAMWEESDEVLKSKVCLLGTTVVTNLFGDTDPIGHFIRVDRYNYRVIGVLESKGQAPIGGDQDDVVVMPIGSMRARIFRTPPGFAGALMMSATSAETNDRAVRQIDSILRQRHRIAEGRDPDFAVHTQKEFLELQQTVYGALTLLLTIVAAVALFIGGIGVMNIMLVSVTERTREIGTRMAIGAREADIRSQFLTEAIVLASAGGLGGVIVGAIIVP